MSIVSEYFTSASRAPYELAGLLKTMPTDMPSGRALTADEKSMALAAARHAANYSAAIVGGLESIGHLMVSAATNADFPVKQDTISSLGGLIYNLAVQLEFLQEHVAEIGFVLHADELRKPAAKKGGAS